MYALHILYNTCIGPIVIPRGIKGSMILGFEILSSDTTISKEIYHVRSAYLSIHVLFYFVIVYYVKVILFCFVLLRCIKLILFCFVSLVSLWENATNYTILYSTMLL